jgi:exopolysaccharide production protein ExoZ
MGKNIEAIVHRQYYFGLDFIRFFAASLVTMFHLTWKSGSTNTLFWYGWVGVQIFFVLSGFVIANSANNVTVLKFVKSRFMRLYPAAIVCGLISLAVLTQTNTLNNLISPFLRSITLFPQGPFLTSSYWTLPVEMAFYAAILIVILLSKFDRISHFCKWLTLVSTLYIISFSCHVFGLVNLSILDLDYGMKNMTLLRHGIYFTIGIYMWLIANKHIDHKDFKYLVIALIAAMLEISTRTYEIISIINVEALTFQDFFLIPIIIFFFTIALMNVSVLSLFTIKLPLIIQKTLRVAGLITYPLYLLHESVAYGVKKIMIIEAGTSQLIGALTGYISAILVAVLVAMVFEKRIRDVFYFIFSRKVFIIASNKYQNILSIKGGVL